MQDGRDSGVGGAWLEEQYTLTDHKLDRTIIYGTKGTKSRYVGIDELAVRTDQTQYNVSYMLTDVNYNATSLAKESVDL